MKNKIYITCLHLNHGGVEMAVSLLSNALLDYGYDVELLCTYNFGTPAYELDPRIHIRYLTNVLPNRERFHEAVKNKNVISIFKEGLYSLKVLYLKKQTLKKAICSVNDGIIISTRNEDTLLLSKYGQPSVKKIAQLHHDHKFNPKLIRNFQKGYNQIDYFVLLTDQLCQEVSDFMKPYNTKTKCLTIPNFLNFSSTASNQPVKKKQVVAVGRLHTDKAFHRLLTIWAHTAPSHPDWTLKIIGDGPLQAQLEEQCRNLSLTDSVIFTGAMNHSDVMREMSASSIYAMTSISEAFPFVLLEAMYNRLPVVAYDVRVGPRALVVPDKTGYLVKDDDVDAFAASLSELMDNAEKLTEFQTNAFHHVQQFSQTAVLEKWIQILD